MADPDPRTSPERSSATGPWQAVPAPAPAPASVAEGGDPPTVRTGSGSAASGPGVGPGSSYSRGPLGDVEPMPRPGDRLGVFALQDAIGVGGMGAVFRAHDDQLDRAVALKVLPPEHARDPEAVQPVLPGGPRRRAARPREHRAGLHDRPGRPASLHRLRVHRGDDAPPARRGGRRPAGGRRDQLHAPDRHGAGARDRAGRRAPRRQAFEHHRDAAGPGEARRHGPGPPLRARGRRRADAERA